MPPDQQVIIEFRDLLADPKKVVEEIYERFGLEIGPDFERFLEEEREAAKAFRSQHVFDPEQVPGPERDRIRRELADLFERFGWQV